MQQVVFGSNYLSLPMPCSLQIWVPIQPRRALKVEELPLLHKSEPHSPKYNCHPCLRLKCAASHLLDLWSLKWEGWSINHTRLKLDSQTWMKIPVWKMDKRLHCFSHLSRVTVLPMDHKIQYVTKSQNCSQASQYCCEMCLHVEIVPESVNTSLNSPGRKKRTSNL